MVFNQSYREQGLISRAAVCNGGVRGHLQNERLAKDCITYVLTVRKYFAKIFAKNCLAPCISCKSTTWPGHQLQGAKMIKKFHFKHLATFHTDLMTPRGVPTSRFGTSDLPEVTS